MEYTQDPQTAYHEYLELCRKNIHTLALHSQNRRTPQGKKEEKIPGCDPGQPHKQGK